MRFYYHTLLQVIKLPVCSLTYIFYYLTSGTYTSIFVPSVKVVAVSLAEENTSSRIGGCIKCMSERMIYPYPVLFHRAPDKASYTIH